MRSSLLALFVAVSSFTASAHADAPRAITAAEMQKLWDETPPAKLTTVLPGGSYRITGKVLETEDGAVYLATDHKNKFKQDEKIALQFASLPKVKRGAAFTATCEFHGRREGGNLTMTECAL